MAVLEVPISEALLNKIKELSENENISVENFASSAIAEKISIQTDKNYLQDRFKNKTREDFRSILKKVPDVEPPEYDRL